MNPDKLLWIAISATFHTIAGAAFTALCWALTGCSFNPFGRISAVVLLLGSLAWGVRVGVVEHYRELGRYR